MYCKNFSELSREDAAIAGGKGASLGEMTNAEIPVPPGFVVLADAFEKFLEETDLNIEIDSILHSVDTKAMHTVEHASETIQKLILEAKMPEDITSVITKDFAILDTQFVAVRSSATAEDSASAAWAGQLDSFLNTTEETLLQNVQRCWASLFTPRAIFYRFEQGLHDSKISVAVVVQKMVESEVSGIAFSVHPVTEDRNQLIIEAGYGLGEAIVSGQITPDSYVVEKSPRRIIDTNIAEQERGIYRREKGEMGGNEWRSVSAEKRNLQKLSNEQILELSEIIIGIERHYGFPCDIEWAFENNTFYIVQSRPITTLTPLSVSVVLDNSVIPSREWFKFIERSEHFFVYTAFARTDSYMLRDALGFGFPESLYRYQNGLGANYRDREVYQKANEYFFSLMDSDDPRILKCAEEGVRMNHFADQMLQRYKNPQALERLQPSDFKECFDMVLGILLYGCTIPYLFLESADYAKSINKWEKRHEKHIKALEPLRAVSKYFELEELVLSRFFEFAADTMQLKDCTLARFLMPDEIEQVFSGVSTVTEKDLKCRSEWCVFWTCDGGRHFEFLYDRKIVQQYHFFIDPMAKSADEFSGTVAYRGKTQGKVRIVNTKAEMMHFVDNEILVSQSTNPMLMPAILKCGAIVTDEGGMASHAAIIARELKKPCIIGTKIATQVLHDGDLVEVDACPSSGVADNGVVRVIKQA